MSLPKTTEKSPNGRFRLAISACLLGHEVRYNAGHKRHGFCADQLARIADLVPMCPEVAIGLPTPRPAIRQVHRGDVIAVEWSKSKAGDEVVDFAPALAAKASEFLAAHKDLDGYIFMHDSPSCGSTNVKTYRANGYQASRAGVGAFSAVIMASAPLMPVEDAGRLNDPVIRENFMVRVGVYRAWRLLQTRHQPLTMGDLIGFYSPYKYLLMAHSQAAYKAVGRLLANHDRQPVAEVAERFITLLMDGFKVLANRKGHSNVLLHMLGYFKKHLSSDDRQEMLDHIEAYRCGITPLVTPLVLMRHHAKRLPGDYLMNQVYWQPHDAGLGLRSAI